MAAIATTESSQAALNAELMAAAASGSAEGVRAALGRGAEAFHQEDARGTSALMAAAGAGSLEGVEALLAEGAPWNALDRFAKCAGDYALRGGHQDVVNALVEAGVRAELIFGQLEETSKALQAEAARENAAYISRDVRYEGAAANLLDGDKGVMMEWEAPLMETHAEILCQGSRRGGSVGSDTAMDDGEGAGGVGGGGAMCGDILNVGFGMGIIDSAIQQRRPRTHTIIEAHPNVYARMLAQGWDKRPGVIIKFGRWQDVVHGLIAEGRKFDGIMFDTFNDVGHVEEFHEVLPSLLKVSGIYSFFNGMCPENVFFQGVAAEVIKRKLAARGLSAEFLSVEIEVDESAWEGVGYKYFTDNTYYLPVIQWEVAGSVGADKDDGSAGAGAEYME